MSLVEAGWDAEAARRPHGQRTTVVVHVDVGQRASPRCIWARCCRDDERRYLTCDATCEVWFERARPGRSAPGGPPAPISRRLRRALEHRDRCCVVPGCGATRGLHAHHIEHWEDGGPTELANLVLVCPYHHRLHHRGVITITGPAHHLVVTDSAGRTLSDGIAGPPTHHTPTRGPALAPDRPANAPTGGGTNPSNHNHHRRPTEPSPGPVMGGRGMGRQEVGTESNPSLPPRRRRTRGVTVDSQTRAFAEPLRDDAAHALIRISPDGTH